MQNRLVQFKRGTFTQDTVEVLRRLEKRLEKLRARITIEGVSQLQMGWEAVRENPGPTGLPPEWSAIPTGREVYLSLTIQEYDGPQETHKERALAMLWAIAVPLGLVPYTRYPLPGPHDTVFHYFGKWAILVDQLLGSGRGEAGWPSFCCAAQLEVGKWQGGHITERLVQAHLHRLGLNIGPIDGIIGNKTQGALKALGLHSLPMSEIATKVAEKQPYVPESFEKEVTGHIVLNGVDFSINPYGQVHAIRTPKGVDLHVSGPGRVVLDVREPVP